MPTFLSTFYRFNAIFTIYDIVNIALLSGNAKIFAPAYPVFLWVMELLAKGWSPESGGKPPDRPPHITTFGNVLG